LDGEKGLDETPKTCDESSIPLIPAKFTSDFTIGQETPNQRNPELDMGGDNEYTNDISMIDISLVDVWIFTNL
jgi:hypothetical protein